MSKDPRGSGARGTRAKSISQMTPQQRKAFQKFKTKREDEKVSAMGGYKSGGRAGYKFGKSVEENMSGKPISKSKNPGLLAMSKTAKGKEVVKKMKFNPKRIVAKKGGKV